MLLIDTLSGEQKLIDVEEGGEYFDPSKVLWDERADGQLPEIILGGMTRVDGSLVYDTDRMTLHEEAVAAMSVPQSVLMWKARTALSNAGKLQLVQPAIDAMSEPQKTNAEIVWNYAIAVDRQNEFTLLLGQAVGLDSKAMDELFIAAGKL